jgi:hypothetical protein
LLAQAPGEASDRQTKVGGQVEVGGCGGGVAGDRDQSAEAKLISIAN